MNVGAYHGDARPEEVWTALEGEPGAALVDVRTSAEWNYVGLPDVSATPAPLLRFEWQTLSLGRGEPGLRPNPG